MSRSLYGFLALGALAIVLTDSDPDRKPRPGRVSAGAVEVAEPLGLEGHREGMVVNIPGPEPEPAAIEDSGGAEEVAPAAVEVAYVPPPPAPREDSEDTFRSTWASDQEESALDPEVQVKRIDRSHDVEAVFLIDTTGSMGWIFETAREKALHLVKALEASRDEGKTVRAALVDYKDRREVYGSDGRHHGHSRSSHLDVTPLTSDWSELRGAFAAMRASGGGDLEEDTQGALLAALDDLAWTDGEDVTRLVYLIGDAPAKHYPDQPGMERLSRRLASQGFRVHTFNASGEHHPHHKRVEADWRTLADATGGSYEVIRRAGDAEHPPRVVCKKPVRLRASAGGRDLDLWIGPGDAEPELAPLERGYGIDSPTAPTAPRPRKLGGLGLEVWSDI